MYNIPKVKKIKLQFLLEGQEDYGNEGVFNNTDECLTHLLCYMAAIEKYDTTEMINAITKFLTPSDIVKEANNEI